jgi:hypothetical protein
VDEVNTKAQWGLVEIAVRRYLILAHRGKHHLTTPLDICQWPPRTSGRQRTFHRRVYYSYFRPFFFGLPRASHHPMLESRGFMYSLYKITHLKLFKLRHLAALAARSPLNAVRAGDSAAIAFRLYDSGLMPHRRSHTFNFHHFSLK